MPTPEQNTQLAVMKWLQLQHPEVHQHVIKIDNEGKRTLGGHILAKNLGLHKGASDLFIAYPHNGYHGFWLELKRDGWRGPGGKKETEHVNNQIEFQRKMLNQGYHAAFATGVDEAIKALDLYLTPAKKQAVAAKA